MKCARAQTHIRSGDSPHHCSLMSYSLHLCNIHLSPLTGPGNSIYPSYLYPQSVSPHCVPLNSDRLPSSSLSLSLRSEDRTWMVAILMRSHVLRWRLVWCPCVRSRHKALCWAANQLAGHPLSPSSGESMWCMSIEDFSWGWYLVENHLDMVSQLACVFVCCLPGIL